MHIGFVGLGAMGHHLASHLLEAGYDVTVYDVREPAVESLVESGADGGMSPADVAEEADIVFLSLPGPEEVEAVVLGADGLTGGAASGTVIVDLTTSLPETTERIADALADRGAHVLGAPVSGGERGARAGTLSVMVGGDEQILAECEPAIETFADRIFHVGEQVSAGHAVKLLNNYLWGIGFFATTETILLGDRLGLDPDTVLDVINASSGRNTLTEEVFPEYVLSGTDLDYPMDLFEKDIRLFTELGEGAHMPLLLGAHVRQLVGLARAGCGGDADAVTAYDLFDELLGDGS